METYSDIEILRGLKNRQGYVVKFITREYLPAIRYMIGRMGGSQQDVEDIFQEALMSIIKKVDNNNLKLTCSFSTYLYAVCKNQRLMQISEKKKEREYLYNYLKEVYYPEPPGIQQTKDEQEKIYRYYFKQLSNVCKKILELYTVKLPVIDIAKELGNTEKYVRKRKYECKTRLARLVMENKDRI